MEDKLPHPKGVTGVEEHSWRSLETAWGHECGRVKQVAHKINSLRLDGNVEEAAHAGHKSTGGVLGYRSGSAVKKKALAVLPENQGSIPSTHNGSQLFLTPGGYDTLF